MPNSRTKIASELTGPTHKPVCRANAEFRAKVKTASKDIRQAGSADGQGTTEDLEVVASSLKLLSQTSRPIFTLAALEAFRSDRCPQNIMKNIPWVEVELTGNPHPHDFRLKTAEMWTLDDLRQKYQVGTSAFVCDVRCTHLCRRSLRAKNLCFNVSMRTTISRRKYRRRRLGIAVAIVSCREVKNLIPLGLGISDKPSGEPPKPEL